MDMDLSRLKHMNKTHTKLTPDQVFTTIITGMNRKYAIPDDDGVEIGIFLLMDQTGCIDSAGSLPFSLMGHEEYLCQLAQNRLVVIGRKTFETVYHGKAVPGSLGTIVLSKSMESSPEPLVYVVHHPREVVRKAKAFGQKKVWVLGGVETFRSMMSWSDVILIDYANAVCQVNTGMYPQELAETVYGDGMIWLSTAKTDHGVTHMVSEYHRRDAAGRAKDAICGECPFTELCNGWEYADFCMRGLR